MIPYFDYRPRYRELHDEIRTAVDRVLESGRLILGPEVEAFERECAEAVGQREGVGVNSGTDALALALRALGVGAGDEVVTVANAGVPPVAAIRAAGAVPRFVDVDPETLVLDPEALPGALTGRTRCVLPVHLYGQPAPMDRVRAFADAHRLAVVEDCAQAQGAVRDGAPAGSTGDAACFSFYPTKTLGAYGDGGLCAVRDPELAARLRSLRTYGYRGDRHAHEEGVNTRLDELQAAILRVKLRHLDDDLARRRAIAERYRAGLAGTSLKMVGPAPGTSHAWHLCVVRCPERARVTAALDRAGIGWGVHYPEPVHRMEAYRFLGVREGELPVTEAACREVLSLPVWPGLDDGRVDAVVRTLRSVPPAA